MIGEMRRTQIYLDESLDRELRQRAVFEGRSAAAIIREAVRGYLASAGTAPADRGDPILAMAGTLRGGRDASATIDRDLYGRGSHPA